MSILTATGLSKHFGAQDIFSNVNISAGHGDRIGLVGANGSGKTTLLRILVGLEIPSGGQVYRSKDLRIGYLAQEATLTDNTRSLWDLALSAFDDLRRQAQTLRDMEQAMGSATDPEEQDRLLARYGQLQDAFDLAGGYGYEYRIRQILSGLGFQETDYYRPLAQLSGGQQTRAQLAHLLLSRPDLLLLDEPTNHLDMAAVEWLEEYLLGWDGAMVIVSHDRYFLDKVSTRIWDMVQGGITSYRGNYSGYVLQSAANWERQRREYERQQEFVTKEEDFIRRNIAGQRTKEAQGRRKRLERMALKDRPTVERQINLDLSADLRSGDLVLATHNLVVGFDPADPLFRCPDLEIRRRERVALLGPNGAGKTTFLRTILKEVKPLTGNVRIGSAVELGYFAQAHAGLDLSCSVLDELLAVKNLPLAEMRNYLARFLFTGDDIFKPIANLSGGERARVALAKLSLVGSNFLVLDEPTNHLDIPSQEILQDVLADFSGTILLVSHDRYFIQSLATQVWALEKNQIFVSKGGYTAYLKDREARRAEQAPGIGSSPKSSTQARQGDSGNGGAKRKGEYRRQQALMEVEAQIHAAEQQLAHLAEELEQASRAQAVERVIELGEDYRYVEGRLEELLEQWASLEAT